MKSKSAFSLEGRNAAVVGAGSGIGRAVAIGLAEAGARVLCLDIEEAAAAGTASAIGAGGAMAESATADILDGPATAAALAAFAARRGSLDVAVSTPGLNVRKPLLDYTDAEIDRVLALNLKGTAHVLQAAGRIMKAQRSGSIIVFSSIRSIVVEPGQSMYAAAKAGIVQMARAAAAELGPHGVRVNAVAPGVIDTPLTGPIKHNPEWRDAYARRSILGRWGEAAEMAGPAVFLASDAASYVTGSVLFADGGWTAIDGRFAPPGM